MQCNSRAIFWWNMEQQKQRRQVHWNRQWIMWQQLRAWETIYILTCINLTDLEKCQKVMIVFVFIVSPTWGTFTSRSLSLQQAMHSPTPPQFDRFTHHLRANSSGPRLQSLGCCSVVFYSVLFCSILLSLLFSGLECGPEKRRDWPPETGAERKPPRRQPDSQPALW